MGSSQITICTKILSLLFHYKIQNGMHKRYTNNSLTAIMIKNRNHIHMAKKGRIYPKVNVTIIMVK